MISLHEKANFSQQLHFLYLSSTGLYSFICKASFYIPCIWPDFFCYQQQPLGWKHQYLQPEIDQRAHLNLGLANIVSLKIWSFTLHIWRTDSLGQSPIYIGKDLIKPRQIDSDNTKSAPTICRTISTFHKQLSLIIRSTLW